MPAEQLAPVVAALCRHEAQRRGQQAAHAWGDWAASLDALLEATASRQQLREELEELNAHDDVSDRCAGGGGWKGGGTGIRVGGSLITFAVCGWVTEGDARCGCVRARRVWNLESPAGTSLWAAHGRAAAAAAPRSRL